MKSHPILSVVTLFALTLTLTNNAALASSLKFLTVAGTGTGNATSTQFTSQHGNGVINVTHQFSPGGAGLDDNNNALIFPSLFPTLFPGSGQIQGHLAQTVYNHTSLVTFDLTSYTLSKKTVFGIWNATTQVQLPAYRVQLLNSVNVQVNPTTFNLIGNEGNNPVLLPQGEQYELTMSPTGQLGIGTLLNINGIHSDAAFWNNIPAGTKEIRVYGNLPPLNNIGDGVGYYFADCPEPSSCVLMLASFSGLLFRRR